jgi:hypothetical protein
MYGCSTNTSQFPGDKYGLTSFGFDGWLDQLEPVVVTSGSAAACSKLKASGMGANLNEHFVIAAFRHSGLFVPQLRWIAV